MATISSSGIGSGLDVESIITKLMAVEKQPVTALQTKATAIQTQLSTVGTIKSQMSDLYDAAFNLSLDRGWSGSTISSTNSSAVAASISGAPTAGQFSVEVSQLAQAQSAVSSVISPTAVMGTGQLTIELGKWSSDSNGTAFTAKGTPATINLTAADTKSLAGIASKINDADAGVTATVLTDVSGQRLVIRSNATGVESGFRITAKDSNGANLTSGAGLSQFAFDLTTTTANPAVGYGMAGVANVGSYRPAQNALATINGVPVESTTNSFKDGVPGVSLEFSAKTTAPVTIQVAADRTALKANIQKFVDAYNTVVASISDATKYDSQTKTAGVLQGDSVIANLKNSLRGVMNSAGSGSTYARLAEVGLDMDVNGKMSVQDGKLTAAMQDIGNLKKLFAQDNNSPLTNGIARKIKDFANGLLSLDGTVTSKEDGLQKAITRNTAEQDKINARLSSTEARLRKQYANLDVRMSSLTALNTYVTQQVQSWNNTGKN